MTWSPVDAPLVELGAITGNLIGIAQYAMLGKVNWRALLPGKRPAPVLATRKK